MCPVKLKLRTVETHTGRSICLLLGFRYRTFDNARMRSCRADILDEFFGAFSSWMKLRESGFCPAIFLQVIDASGSITWLYSREESMLISIGYWRIE